MSQHTHKGIPGIGPLPFFDPECDTCKSLIALQHVFGTFPKEPITIIPPFGTSHADGTTKPKGPATYENTANARLIAKAPEMLDALRECAEALASPVIAERTEAEKTARALLETFMHEPWEPCDAPPGDFLSADRAYEMEFVTKALLNALIRLYEFHDGQCECEEKIGVACPHFQAWSRIKEAEKYLDGTYVRCEGCSHYMWILTQQLVKEGAWVVCDQCHEKTLAYQR